MTPYARIHQARKLIRAQGLLHVVGRPKLHGLKVAAHVEALGQHNDRQVPVDLDGPLDQEAALEIPAPLTDNDFKSKLSLLRRRVPSVYEAQALTSCPCPRRTLRL